MLKRLIILILLLIPNSYAWDWYTHQNFALKVVNSLPRDLNFNLTLVEEGSIAPDKLFHDYKKHSYPYSYVLIEYWLNQSMYYKNSKDYNEMSYAYGIMTHYLVDSFSDPHYISKEDSNLHGQYEKQRYYKIKTSCNNYDLSLNETLYHASKENYWQEWISTKNKLIPQKRIEDATKLLYSITLTTFNTTCQPSTIIEKSKFKFNYKALDFLIVVIAIFIIYLIIKKSKLSKN